MVGVGDFLLGVSNVLMWLVFILFGMVILSGLLLGMGEFVVGGNGCVVIVFV